jgi:hypothetical protein
MEKEVLLTLLRSKSTVFSFQEIHMMTSVPPRLLKRRLNYYIKNGQLYSMRRGFYAKDNHYDRRELATKIFTPAYVSFETVLLEAGAIFQYYSTIFVATYQTREVMCDGQNYGFKKLKDTLLVTPDGVKNRGAYFMATPERAYLDLLYLHKDYYIDNLSALDFEKVFSLLSVYNNKRMEKVVQRHYKKFQDEW